MPLEPATSNEENGLSPTIELPSTAYSTSSSPNRQGYSAVDLLSKINHKGDKDTGKDKSAPFGWVPRGAFGVRPSHVSDKTDLTSTGVNNRSSKSTAPDDNHLPDIPDTDVLPANAQCPYTHEYAPAYSVIHEAAPAFSPSSYRVASSLQSFMTAASPQSFMTAPSPHSFLSPASHQSFMTAPSSMSSRVLPYPSDSVLPYPSDSGQPLLPPAPVLGRPVDQQQIFSKRNESAYAALIRDKGLLLSKDAELNWSGRGQHLEFGKGEEVPLVLLSVIGHTASALVEMVLCRRVVLARKSIHCTRKMTPAVILNEVEHLQRFRHRHIIQLVGTYLQGKTISILLYPVTEWNLTTFMEALLERSLPSHDPLGSINAPQRAVASLCMFFSCLASAFEYIHTNTTKHMDIKPQNILVRNPSKWDLWGGLYSKNPVAMHYRVYVADFGLSRSFSSQEHSQTEGPTSRTPMYCAPEVYTQDWRGRSADVFSLGCVFAEMQTTLCGRSIEEFREFRAGDDESYRSNLTKVDEWLETVVRDYWHQVLDGTVEEERTILGLTMDTANRLIFILGYIKKMLSEDPQLRPTAKEILVQLGPNEDCCNLQRESYEVAPPSLYARQ
ncbi:MAG: hypothetical protein M1812_004942 [Candelaria pacifica]|nr:MAG: hypothetical protein M1812_004942 [Candelaria pacifica]